VPVPYVPTAAAAATVVRQHSKQSMPASAVDAVDGHTSQQCSGRITRVIQPISYFAKYDIMPYNMEIVL